MYPESSHYRLVIVAPTFNNAPTLPALLGQLDRGEREVVVVNDGSTDDTATILDAWKRGKADRKPRHVVTHPANMGKAAALRTGFERALGLGFTHALTIDTDGQHDTADIAALVTLSQEQPQALVLGARPSCAANYPRRSLMGRRISNAFVWLESGVRVADSQCGLRVYPLDHTLSIGSSARRYGFETEVLTRFAWAGLDIAQVPVRCIYDPPGGRTTHFRPFADSLSAGLMHLRLLARSLFPWPITRRGSQTATGTLMTRFGRWMNPLRVWHDVRANDHARRRFAASVSTGAFMAALPPFGMKTVTCLLLSRWFRLQPVVVIAVSSLNTPPIGTLLSMMSIVTGHLLLHRTWPSLHTYDPRTQGVWALLKTIGVEWISGSLVLGAALAVATYAVARVAMLLLPHASDSSANRADERSSAGRDAFEANPLPLAAAGALPGHHHRRPQDE